MTRIDISDYRTYYNESCRAISWSCWNLEQNGKLDEDIRLYAEHTFKLLKVFYDRGMQALQQILQLQLEEVNALKVAVNSSKRKRDGGEE